MRASRARGASSCRSRSARSSGSSSCSRCRPTCRTCRRCSRHPLPDPTRPRPASTTSVTAWPSSTSSIYNLGRRSAASWRPASPSRCAFCGLSSIASAGRMLFAFSRDDGVPGSGWLKKVSHRYRTPANALIAIVVIAWLFTVAAFIVGPRHGGRHRHRDQHDLPVRRVRDLHLPGRHDPGLAQGAGLEPRPLVQADRLGRRLLGRRPDGPVQLPDVGQHLAARSWSSTVLFLLVYYFGWARRSFKGPRAMGDAAELTEIEREFEHAAEEVADRLTAAQPRSVEGRPDRHRPALASPHRRPETPMSDHDEPHAAKHPRLVELEEMVRDGQIDTIVVAITDMQGRLMGKRVQGQAFLDGVIAHGAHFCTYLLGTDMEMNTPEGYKLMNWETGYGDWIAEPIWDQLRVLPWLPGTAMVLADAVDEETGRRDPDRAADDPQAPGRARRGGRLRAQGRLGVRVLRPQGLVGGARRARLAGPANVRPLQRGLPPPPGHQGGAAPPPAAQPDDRRERARSSSARARRPTASTRSTSATTTSSSRPTGASSSSTGPRRSPTSTAGASRSWPSRTTAGPARRATST